MSVTIEHPKANILIKNLRNGKRNIDVTLLDKSIYSPQDSCQTDYPDELINSILNVVGPAWLCHEITRLEHPLRLGLHMEKAILGYVDNNCFNNKRILDLGCGAGSSTMLLARMFPASEIVALDIDYGLLSIARLRAKYYKFNNIDFVLSEDGERLPEGIGSFDFVILVDVFEHLLPAERELLLPQVWSILKSGGILFINQIPNRYFPIEKHTTGLPLVNYLPDRMAAYIGRKFSKRVKKDETWRALLRRGIRGGTVYEIMNLIRTKCRDEPILMKPNKYGTRDIVDLWYVISTSQRSSLGKLLLRSVCKFIYLISGIPLVPNLSIAIQKKD